MIKNPAKKAKKDLIQTIENKYGIELHYKSDKELHDHLKKSGVPSLSRLLKIVHS